MEGGVSGKRRKALLADGSSEQLCENLDAILFCFKLDKLEAFHQQMEKVGAFCFLRNLPSERGDDGFSGA